MEDFEVETIECYRPTADCPNPENVLARDKANSISEALKMGARFVIMNEITDADGPKEPWLLKVRPVHHKLVA